MGLSIKPCSTSSKKTQLIRKASVPLRSHPIIQIAEPSRLATGAFYQIYRQNDDAV
jgi:hypothetical protein